MYILASMEKLRLLLLFFAQKTYPIMRENKILKGEVSMLKKFTTRKRFKNDLEEMIDKTSKSMLKLEPGTGEYDKLLRCYERLTDIKDKNRKGRVNSETIAGIFGSLAGIGLIIGHERLNIITSKALGFVLKRRV